MRFYEIISLAETEAGATHRKPLTPAQLVKRSERARRTQDKITAERTKSAAKVNDLKADLP